MSYCVNQHWDPLKTCVVGKSYPPEFYSWISNSRVRGLFEKIAQETEEDYLAITAKLQEFGVQVLRPDIGDNFGQYLLPDDSRWLPPPMTPRDMAIMIGDTFYHRFPVSIDGFSSPWQSIIDQVSDRVNHIYHLDPTEVAYINGATVSRIGKDLYFGTAHVNDDVVKIKNMMDAKFPNYRNHVINTGGHGDTTYCPVCPGLIVSLYDVKEYTQTFPDWEVVYLPNQSWDKVQPFLDLKEKNKGKWWIPGWEYDHAVIEVVESWLSNWVGYVEETVFDVNMLIIDPKNVMVFNYNQQVFDALNRHGITPHVVPFRHRYFWDGGIHCVTLDLDRTGQINDYFLERN